MRPILAKNLIVTSNSFANSTLPSLNTPGSSPLLRPISSPMTPITPLMLSEADNEARYEKAHEAGYFFYNPREELYTNSPYYYTATQPQVTVNISPSPLSSNITTPTNTNSPQAVNHSGSLHYMNSDDHHKMMISSYTAPSHGNHYNYNYYNQQLYNSGNNVGSQYETLENAYSHYYNHDAKIQNQDDAQFHEMISGLGKMDIVDSR